MKDNIIRKKNETNIRVFDFLLSLFGLILLSPLFLIISLLILGDSGKPIFYRQTRVGLEEREFQILKFRSMKHNQGTGSLITIGNDNRITRIGKFIRMTKIDELPQLINVIKGEMGLVGPRPEVKKYVEYYSLEEKKVLSVRPGITDYASIKYRNESEILSKSTNPEEIYINEIMRDKLKINMKYINKRSLKENIKVIFLTIKKIFI